ncbi:uncharacterized protein [Medicago truncatula]|uniref:uncharacterized protein n=1 Tax=Medicago truncatula TaxID=3880 RepID=UPI001967C0C6|nr:uncharacterized protein LOC120579939 [Medicago truncatula]
MEEGNPPAAWPKLGDYGLANHRGRLTHVFQPANPVAFDIKASELELKFLEKYFPMSKYSDKKQEIAGFRQGEGESLYDAWERFNLLLKRCPGHEFSEKQYLQFFTEGLTHSNIMFLDASAGGSLRVKTDHEVQTLIENMASNEYRAEAKKKERGVFGVSVTTSILANQAAMNKQIETLTKEVHAYQLSNKQLAAAIRCDLCGEGHPNGECVLEGASEEANYVNYQRQNPYSMNKHPNLSYSNNNTLNPLLPNPQQQQQPRKPSGLEETMMNFMKMTQSNFEEMKKSQDLERKNNEASRKMLETQFGQLAKQLSEQNKGGFSGNTKENPKYETCNAIELRSKKVLTPLAPKVPKKVDERVVEVDEDDEVEEVVEKESDQGVVEKESDQGVVENEKKKKIEGEKSEKFIDEDSILRNEAKKKKKEEGQFKKLMQLFSQLQVNIPFGEPLEQMPIYAKFMKEMLTGRRKPKDDENISLSENCSAILQRKLPPMLKDPGAFTIPCSVGPVDIGRA